MGCGYGWLGWTCQAERALLGRQLETRGERVWGGVGRGVRGGAAKVLLTERRQDRHATKAADAGGDSAMRLALSRDALQRAARSFARS